MSEEKKPLFKKWWFWLIVIFVVAIVGGTFGNKGTSSNTSSVANVSSASATATSSSSASAAATSTMPDKNGFDPSTNITVNIAGLQFQVPQYFTASTKQSDDGSMTYYYAEAGNGLAMIMTSQQASSITSSQISAKKNEYFEGVVKGLSNATLKSTKDIDLNGTPAAIATIVSEASGIPLATYFVFFVNDDSSEIGVIALSQTNQSHYDYTSDFSKVLSSAQKVTTANETPQGDSSVSPDLKQFLDSYESFMDEYISFMKSYAQSPTSVEALSKLSTYMQKYAEFMSAVDKYNPDTLSPADAAYYIEVTSRVTQKLLSANL